MLRLLVFSATLVYTFIGHGYAAPKDLSLNHALAKAEQTEQNIFVYINADWCLPCQLVKEGLLADRRVKQKLDQNYVHVEVDIDNAKQKDWTEEYGSSCLPHFLILNEKGAILKEIEGSLPFALFFNMLIEFSTKETFYDNSTEPVLVLMDNAPVSSKIYPTDPKESILKAEPKELITKELVRKAIPTPIHKTITIGTFSIETNATNFMQKMRNAYAYDLFIDRTDKGHYRLNIRNFHSVEDFASILQELKSNRIDHYIRTIHKS